MKKLKISEKTNIKISVIIAYASLFLSSLIAIFYSPFLLKTYGDRTYGIYSFSESLVAWLSIFSFGLTSTYIRFATIAEKEGGDKLLRPLNGFYVIVLATLTLLGVLAGGVVFILLKTGVIPLTLYTDPEKDLIYLLVALSIAQTIIYLPFDFFNLYNNYRNHFIWVRLGAFTTSVLTPLVVIPFVQSGLGIWIVLVVGIAVQLAVSLSNVAFAFLALKVRISWPSRAQMKSQIKTIFIFSFFIFINTIVDQVNNNVAKTLLGIMVGAEAVTIYSFGMQLSTKVITMGQSITTTLAPRINREVANGNQQNVSTIFLNASTITGFLMLYIFGGFLSCGQDFIIAWIGAKRSEAYYVGLVLIFFWTLPLAEMSGVEVQRAMNKHKFRSLILAATTLLNVALSFVFLLVFPENLKIAACLIASAVSSFLGHWVAQNLYFGKALHLPVTTYLKSFARLLGITLVASLLCYGASSLGLLVSTNKWIAVLQKAIIFSIFYFIIFAAIDPENWSKIKGIIGRRFPEKKNNDSENQVNSKKD